MGFLQWNNLHRLRIFLVLISQKISWAQASRWASNQIDCRSEAFEFIESRRYLYLSTTHYVKMLSSWVSGFFHHLPYKCLMLLAGLISTGMRLLCVRPTSNQSCSPFVLQTSHYHHTRTKLQWCFKLIALSFSDY